MSMKLWLSVVVFTGAGLTVLLVVLWASHPDAQVGTDASIHGLSTQTTALVLNQATFIADYIEKLETFRVFRSLMGMETTRNSVNKEDFE